MPVADVTRNCCLLSSKPLTEAVCAHSKVSPGDSSDLLLLHKRPRTSNSSQTNPSRVYAKFSLRRKETNYYIGFPYLFHHNKAPYMQISACTCQVLRHRICPGSHRFIRALDQDCGFQFPSSLEGTKLHIYHLIV